jgi:hypothetical protein
MVWVQSGLRIGALSVAASLALLAASVPAAAAPKPITGKLSRPGYTVIALAANGKAKVVRASRGRFRLRPPAKRVTLHLRAPSGSYAGPIVLGRKKKGKRAIVGVKAGARLGRVSVRRGYARVSKRLQRKWLDARRAARARRGAPIGARVFGRVRSKPPSDKEYVEGDGDFDGIPDQLDIDDDGDLVLDNLDRSTAARTAQEPPPPPVPEVFTSLFLDLGQTANANALALAGLTEEQIDQRIAAAVSSNGGRLSFSGFSASTELDCGGSRNPSPPPPWLGGLPYCTLGGTGTATSPASPEFPECCDADNDGFGIVPPGVLVDIPQTLVQGTDQIKTGDQVIGHVATVGDVGKCPDALNPACVSITNVFQYVFATVPALVSYHDTAVPRNSATLSYPYPAGAPVEFPVAAGLDGQVRVTLTLWRPQRRPIGEGENREACLDDTPPCRWIDIGGLTYAVGMEGAGPCVQSAYSEDDPTTLVVEDDPNLTLPTGPRVGLLGGLGFTDLAPDRPASAANRLTYTVNLTSCTASSAPWSPGETRGVRLFAVPTQGGGFAQQIVQFKHR